MQGEITDTDTPSTTVGPITAAEFHELFVRFAPAVHRFCAHRTGDLDLAPDLTSITFLEAWRHRDRIERSGAGLPWLLGVAANVTRNAARSRRRYRAALARLERPADEPDHSDAVDDRAAAAQALQRASTAIRTLPNSDQEIFLLVCWEGLTYEQTATALGVPIGTVRSRLTRARARLRTLLDTDVEVL